MSLPLSRRHPFRVAHSRMQVFDEEWAPKDNETMRMDVIFYFVL
jgi:hypothetical protein